MLAIVCPGQGAQTPGMLEAWLTTPGTADLLAEWSVAADLDLHRYGTTADADQIRVTKVAQPLLVATALISARALLGTVTAPPGSIVAGHSVGEFAAAVLAGVLSPEDAIRLVAARGRAMAEVADAAPTGMSAILGGDPDEVAARLAELGLTAANVNGAGQLVAAGSRNALAELANNPPARSRVMGLKVAGAFHTEYMSPAIPTLSTDAQAVTPADPVVEILSNADGQAVPTGAGLVDRLIQQIARPVRWDLVQDHLLARGVGGLIELTPGGVLKGLAKHTMPGVPAVALRSPDDLTAARDVVTTQGTTT